MKQFSYKKKFYNVNSANIVVPIILEQFTPQSAVDFGCGNGTWLKAFKNSGMNDIAGIDFKTPETKDLCIEKNHIYEYNLNEPVDLKRCFDIVLCLESAEHIKKENSDILIESLIKHSSVVVFSAAIPGQGGKGHINEQWPDYWIQKFKKYNYYCYDLIRPKIWNDNRIHCWYRQNIFVFTKKELPDETIFSYKGPIVHPCLLEIKNEDIKCILDGRSGIKTGISVFVRSLLFFIKRFFNGRDGK